MEANICKQCNRQGIHFQNLQTAHGVQYEIKQPTILSNTGQRNLNGHFSKENTDGQEAQGRMLNTDDQEERCQSKLQCGISSHQSEWPSSTSVRTIHAEGGVVRREPSHTVGANSNWYLQYGKGWSFLGKLTAEAPYDAASHYGAYICRKP